MMSRSFIKEYKDVIKHYDEMKLVYDRFVGAINV